MATRCPLCNSRILKTAEGERCMKATCENASGLNAQEGITCGRCGEPMSYSGLDSYGQPHYACQGCGASSKLSH